MLLACQTDLAGHRPGVVAELAGLHYGMGL